MNLCSNGHDEICYEGGHRASCPICNIKVEMQDEIDDLIKETEELKAELRRIDQ